VRAEAERVSAEEIFDELLKKVTIP